MTSVVLANPNALRSQGDQNWSADTGRLNR
jgi:hypothetical protein